MSPRRVIELQGGPYDGRRMPVDEGAEVLLFHDEPVEGITAAYRACDRATRDGLQIFEWAGTSGDADPP